MSLDTKYRPRDYDEVLGQENTVSVLRQFVKEGRGFQQSYLFAGAKGCGKTTLGRILARALLCLSPRNGNACNECESCQAMLHDPPTHECFIEMDAATNSSKEQVQDIVETQKYETFSGRHRVYLIDECHRLSVHAMDGLLKSLEDTVPGSDDRVLVCIFCTTEPEKVRNTISSRCAPTFVIRQVTPDVIGKRLEVVCGKEGIKADPDALRLIAEVTECHVRDALQAVSGVSALGEISPENVKNYMRLDASTALLRILGHLGRDLRAVLTAAEDVKASLSPSACYRTLAEMAMTIFKVKSVGMGSFPSYWDPAHLGPFDGPSVENLVEVASWLSQRPTRASHSMLLCDLAALHQRVAAGVSLASGESVVLVKEVPTHTASAGGAAPEPRPVIDPRPGDPVPTASESAPMTASPPEVEAASADSPSTVASSPPEDPNDPYIVNGVRVDPSCRRDLDEDQPARRGPPEIPVDQARPLLLGRIEELSDAKGARSTG